MGLWWAGIFGVRARKGGRRFPKPGRAIFGDARVLRPGKARSPSKHSTQNPSQGTPASLDLPLLSFFPFCHSSPNQGHHIQPANLTSSNFLHSPQSQFGVMLSSSSSAAAGPSGAHPIARRNSIPHSPASTYASSASLASLPDCFSSSASSSTGSFPPFSSCPSPSSSLSSSPALKAVPGALPVLDDLALDDRQPTQREVAAYAATTIRNEAYALLALASRIAPAGLRIVGEAYEYQAQFSAESHEREDRTPSDSGSEGTSSQEFEYEQVGSPKLGVTVEETRTNSAFTQAIRLLSSLPPHGKILVTGVGKSGIAGQKMVATFNSLGK